MPDFLEGSFPFQINWDDVKKVLKNAGVLALSAVITYFLSDVVPSIKTDNPIMLGVVWAIKTGLDTLLKYVTDTRPLVEKLRLPYSVYKASLKQKPE